MNPQSRAFGRKALRAIAEFYNDPENERKYQEWKQRREERRAQPASNERATPVTAIPV